ncbi:MAG: hypothetical protein JNM84_05910 [Planctomycetes bacterium]|nr:hypothetical protein [Planctomycetota bacterium]
MSVTVFGIRHHGPGCARSLLHALDRLQPDCVIVEGPPDADAEIDELQRDGFFPPIALVVYAAEDPKRAVFYPFAEFSPEWQALLWAKRHGVPARFADLAWTHRFGASAEEEDGEREAAAERGDPLGWLARADGYADGERWWNDRIEERGGDVEIFAAIAEAMLALRRELGLQETLLAERREAAMRRCLRDAQRGGAERIAFVCGAWHAPALDLERVKKSEDDALLKGLPKTKVATTWTPWTNERLTFASGYGAGIAAPGWYEHLFAGGSAITERWLARAARALRSEELEASSASVIEAVRLCAALAGLRGRRNAGLAETLEAVQHVFAGGSETWNAVLRKRLLVGERLGVLPEGLVRLPLEQDLIAQRKRLRLEPTAAPKTLELDLRESGGLARSVFLHRLLALGIAWGALDERPRSRGTFKEAWALQWKPEFALALVDASAFGTTIVEAAAARISHAAERASALAELVTLLERAQLAELPGAAAAVLAKVHTRSAATAEADALFDAIPPLARLVRYGDSRTSDRAAVRAIARELARRAHLALRAAVSGLSEDAARTWVERLRQHHASLALLEDAELDADLQSALLRMADSPADAELRGLAVRLLREARALAPARVARYVELELSAGQDPLLAARWLAGFLEGSGALIVHDAELLALLDQWMAGLTDEHFQNVLPIARRTFGSFPPPERRALADALLRKPNQRASEAPDALFELDAARSASAIETVARFLGLELAEEHR